VNGCAWDINLDPTPAADDWDGSLPAFDIVAGGDPSLGEPGPWRATFKPVAELVQAVTAPARAVLVFLAVALHHILRRAFYCNTDRLRLRDVLARTGELAPADPLGRASPTAPRRMILGRATFKDFEMETPLMRGG